MNLTGVFAGTLAIVLGLGFWLGLLAMVIGTVLGSLVVGYLSTMGPRTGAGQLPIARMAFGGGVAIPAALQAVLTISWAALVGLFGGEALSVLLGVPFWLAVLVVLGVQGAVGVLGYELIHRLQAVLTVLLLVSFIVLTVKLVGGQEIVTAATVAGADLVGVFVLEVTIAFSLTVSWATYAADFSRYLPAAVSPARVFGFTAAGLTLGYGFVQGIGIAAASLIGAPTAEGVRSVLGGGLLGGLALTAIVVASISSGVMNAYSGSLALQTVGVQVRRPVAVVIATTSAFLLILWLRGADTATRFTDVLLLVSYWIPAFVAVVVIDWRLRSQGRSTVDPGLESTDGRDATAALFAVFISYLAAIPFMNTSLIQGSVAASWHGADIAYLVSSAVAAALYGGYRTLRVRREVR